MLVCHMLRRESTGLGYRLMLVCHMPRRESTGLGYRTNACISLDGFSVPRRGSTGLGYREVQTDKAIYLAT